MKIVAAFDSFKGTMPSREAGALAAEAVHMVYPDAETAVIPVADGGEGTVHALVLPGNRRIAHVTGPDGDAEDAEWGMLEDGKTAVIEMAAAAGLALTKLKNPELTTTFGVGELILAATRAGAKNILLGLGGSATIDAGLGMLSALGASFRDNGGRAFVPRGGTLARVASIDLSGIAAIPPITAMCDVTNPLCGELGAAAVYGPQKGADAEMVARLDAGLRHIARLETRVSSDERGCGAAGGMGYAVRLLGGELRPGIKAVLDAVGFAEALSGSSLVLTGEGCIDEQTSMGKAVGGVARAAGLAGVPTIAFCGKTELDAGALSELGVQAIFAVTRYAATDDEVRAKCRESFKQTVLAAFKMMKIYVV